MTKSLLITPKGLVVDGRELIPVQYSIEMVPPETKPYITRTGRSLRSGVCGSRLHRCD